MTGPRFRRLVKSKEDLILYVEDDDTNWEVADFTLRDEFSLIRAKTAQQAFELISTRVFRLLLLDIELKGSELDGIELARILRGAAPRVSLRYPTAKMATEVPILFVTAYESRYMKPQLLAAGGDEVVYKPIDFTRLILAISRLLGHRDGVGAATVSASRER